MREAASRRASRRLLLRKEVARASLRERRSGSVRVRPSVRVPVIDFIRVRVGGDACEVEVQVSRHPLRVVVVKQRAHCREQQRARHQHRQRAPPAPPQHNPHQGRTDHPTPHAIQCARPRIESEGYGGARRMRCVDTTAKGSAIIGGNSRAGAFRMPFLEFKGKPHIYAHHLTVPYRPLVPDSNRSLNAASADDNLIIYGDNLHALKALLPRYAGRVKCIYIDPPYNTGNENWCYNDRVNSPLMKQWLDKNKPVDGEDLERHDKWLCMMWPRLHLLRELLADDGVIFVSIDDNEQHHLRMLMDEIFGEANFRNNIAVARVKKNIREREHIKSLNLGYNFILFYSKTPDGLVIPPMTYQEKEARWHAFDAPGIRPTMEYELFGTTPPTGRHWMFSKERADELIAEGKLRANPRTGRPQYLLDASTSTMLDSDWTDIQEYDTRFNFPNGEKNVHLIERIIGMLDDKDAIVLDSFAGSGTTAHAVLALNKKDGGNRKFILVECEGYADTVTAERVRRVIKGVPEAREPSLREGLGGSFTYCTLGDPIAVEDLLTGENLPTYSELAAYLLHTASVRLVSEDLQAKNEAGLFYSSETTDYYLLYRPDLEWLRSNEAILNEEKARSIRAVGRKAVVFAADKFMGQRFLTDMDITFCQIPYEIHRPSRSR